MTRLPAEPQAMEAMTGERFPDYKCKSMCARPGCSKFADHAHHIVRRSFIGKVSWVRYDNGDIVGNLVGLCFKDHEEITLGRSKIIYDMRLHRFDWCDMAAGDWVSKGALYPQPPVHGHAHEEDEPKGIEGPGSSLICPGCKRPIPQKRETGEEVEPPKRRKTWTVQVPNEATEDGALVLDTLIEECAALFHRDMSQSKLRYYVLAQALALVIQNGHRLS